MDGLGRAGPLLFGFGIALLGVENVVCARSRIAVIGPGTTDLLVPVLPWLPPIQWLGYVIGLTLAIGGVCVAADYFGRQGALLIGTVLFVAALALQVPSAYSHLYNLSIRTTLFELIALGSAAVVYGGGDLAGPFRMVFAIATIVFGIDHFQAIPFIASLVPSWLPFHRGMARLAGAALVAAGFTMATGLWAQLGATWLGIMFLLWFFVLHVPRALSEGGRHNPAEWSSAFIALAMAGASWILAESFRRSLRRRAW